VKGDGVVILHLVVGDVRELVDVVIFRIQPLDPPLPNREANGVREDDLPDPEDDDLVGVEGALADLIQVDDKDPEGRRDLNLSLQNLLKK